jgi:uncharacterized membrane protein
MNTSGISRFLIAFLFISAGVTHLRSPEVFTRIVPPFLPWPLALVYASGLFEIVGGVSLLLPRFQRIAGYGLILLLIVMWPANIYMAMAHIPSEGWMGDPVVQWVRVPLQLVLMWWVHKASSNPSVMYN